MTSISFSVEYLAALPVPLHEDVKHYMAVCYVDALPSDIPTAANPRAQNLNTPLAKNIEESLKTNPHFGLLNRGMVLTAKTAEYNEQEKRLTLELSDPDFHGCIDGGHTYKIIQKNKDDALKGQFVQIEIFTGVDGFFDQIATARNAFCAVQQKSLAETRGQFDLIKDLVKPFPFADRIAYKQNEQSKDKDIDVAHILGLLTIFNIERYGDAWGGEKHPSDAVNFSKCLKLYLQDTEQSPNHYQKMRPILPEVFALHDYALSNMGQAFDDYDNEHGSNRGNQRPRTLSDVKAIGKGKTKLLNGDFVPHKIPREFYFPCLAPFRKALLENPKTGLYEWIIDPFPLMEARLGEAMYRTVQFLSSSSWKGTARDYAKEAVWSVYQTFLHEVEEEVWKHKGRKQA